MKWYIKLLVLNTLVIFIALCFLQLHNILNYSVTKGFDANDHIYYIETIKNEHRIPLAHEGGQTDHPPLYFLIGSFFNSINGAKILGFVSWIILSISAFFTFKKMYKDWLLSLLGFITVISLPVLIYITPQISNELFSAAVISITLSFYLLNRIIIKTENQIMLGILLGLSILSKVTGIVLVLSIFLDLLIKYKKELKKIIIPLSTILCVIFLVGGSFYLRNFILYSNPFITTTDFPGQFIHQPPGYRDLKFFTDFSAFLKADLFKAHYYSLWAGTFFSWFYDGHNSLIPIQESSKVGILLVFFSFPIFLLAVAGLIREIIKPRFPILLLFPTLLFIFYIYFNIKLPFYSSVKGVYLVSAAIPFAYFVLRGIEGRGKILVITFIALLNIYSVLVIKNFWILKTWL